MFIDPVHHRFFKNIYKKYNNKKNTTTISAAILQKANLFHVVHAKKKKKISFHATLKYKIAGEIITEKKEPNNTYCMRGRERMSKCLIIQFFSKVKYITTYVEQIYIF